MFKGAWISCATGQNPVALAYQPETLLVFFARGAKNKSVKELQEVSYPRDPAVPRFQI